MTVVVQTPFNRHTGNGITTLFGFTFQLLEAGDLEVSLDGMVHPSGFTISGLGVQAGGSITFNAAPGNGVIVDIRRRIPLARSTDYQVNGDLPANVIDEDFDRIWQAMQEQEPLIGGVLRAPYPEQVPDMPPAAERAGRLIAFDSNGNPIAVVPVTDSAAELRLDLANDADPAKGAQLVSFFGAPLPVRLRQEVWASDVGIVVDDPGASVSNTDKFNELFEDGLLVNLGAGEFHFTHSLAIPHGGIRGAGPGQSVLRSDDATSANLITYTGNYAASDNVPVFEGFRIIGNLAKTNGAALSINPAADEAEYLHFSNITFENLPMGIAFERASLWKVFGCNFLACSAAGIRVRNMHVADAGDSVIMGCVFNNPFSSGEGVLQQSSGGLKIVGNKFLGGGSAYSLSYDSSNGGTSVLNFIGNSVEQMANAGMVFSNAAGSAPFSNVIIASNEFGVQPRGVSVDAGITLTEVSITGNIFNLAGSPGTPWGIAADGLNRFLIGDNTFRGNGGASVGVSLTNCSNGKVGVNTYSNLSTVYAISGNTNVFFSLSTQRGTASVSTSGWATYGGIGLYRSPESTVTFPVAFLVAPTLGDVNVGVTTMDGSLSVNVTAVTATGFTYYVTSTVTSVASGIHWSVSGVL